MTQEDKRHIAVMKARARGEALKEWLKTNKLTAATQKEFNALMKKVNSRQHG